MGLDTTHDCWHGPYSMFMRWREWVAAQVGIPLRLMEGFVDYEPDDEDRKWLNTQWRSSPNGTVPMLLNAVDALAKTGGALSWSCFESDPLALLLHHSDCDGKLRWYDCRGIASRLVQIYRQSKDNDLLGHGGLDYRRGCYDSMRRATLRFACGCLRAYKAREDVQFH